MTRTDESEYTTFDLTDAAEFLMLSVSALRAKARAGEVPGSKPGKRWVFLKADLVAYIRSGYPDTWQRSLSDSNKEKDTCHSKNVGKRGGLISLPQVEKEYEDRLGLSEKVKPKNTTTN